MKKRVSETRCCSNSLLGGPTRQPRENLSLSGPREKTPPGSPVSGFPGSFWSIRGGPEVRLPDSPRGGEFRNRVPEGPGKGFWTPSGEGPEKGSFPGGVSNPYPRTLHEKSVLVTTSLSSAKSCTFPANGYAPSAFSMYWSNFRFYFSFSIY